MILKDVMDEVAERLRQAPSLAGVRTSAFPPPSISAPAAFLDFPSDGTYDMTYGRGFDRMNGIVVVAITNKPTGQNSRDMFSKYVDGFGPESVKELLDGDDYTSCDSVRVKDWVTVNYEIGATTYLSVLFNLDIAGQGA